MWRCSVCHGDRPAGQPCFLCDSPRCTVCAEPIANTRSPITCCPIGHTYPQSTSGSTESVEAWMANGCPQ